MGEIRTRYVPFGELLPDRKFFNNEGLQLAQNVVPVHGSYVASQLWSDKSAALAAATLVPAELAASWYVTIGDNRVKY